MKLKITYPTKEREWLSKVSYRNVCKQVELEPVRILRRSVGSIGEALNRFYYQAEFIAPEDAEFSSKGLITANIDRLKNKNFKPKEFNWVNNKADV
jgi:hypothetical protein